MLGEILARGTRLRVVTIEHGMKLEPATVYVAPPACDISLDGERLLTTSASSRAPSHAIDSFFRSLASAGGPMAVGVVLSGSGSDGTVGLRAIKEEGGITFAQDPSTAGQPGMPQSAIDSGAADFALAPAAIADELVGLGAQPYLARAAQIDDAEAESRIFERLRVAHGIDFALYKRSTIDRRIARRMALHKLEKPADYVALLASDDGELRALYNDLLIGVTRFFRDAEPFEALKTVVFPRLLDQRGSEQPIRIWIAGCSTGEEAYSIAISLLELLGDRAGAYRIQIFATDVDDDALARARAGVYPTSIEMDVAPELLQKYFTQTDKGYQLARKVRDLIVFARHNLGKDPPFSRLDLVTCRNVLIYMQAALHRRVMRVFHYALNPNAFLVLGTSESLGDSAELFTLIDRKLKVYAKRDMPATAVFDFSLPHRSPHDDAELGPPPDPRPLVNIGQLADRKVIEKYAPPGVIVDDRLDIVQFRGHTGPYLDPTPGAATLNLAKLARPDLLVALRTTAGKVLVDGLPSTSPPIPLRSPSGERSVSIDVLPLPEAGGRRCLLVLFQEAAREPGPAARPVAGGGDGQPRADARNTELERELATAKEYLQSTIEELEAANEELQSANEELQSSNEELQSANEELETSREELQSTNEELATVNDELQNRMLQLSIANDDLHNVLLNATSALIIVGTDLRIRRFSSSAERLLNLVSGDVGRPIAYLCNVVSARDIEMVAAESLASNAVHEQRVRCIDGSWHQMRMVPYRTADHALRGLVIELVRSQPPPGTPESTTFNPFAERVMAALPTAAMLVDRQKLLVLGEPRVLRGVRSGAWLARATAVGGVGPGAREPVALRRRGRQRTRHARRAHRASGRARLGPRDALLGPPRRGRDELRPRAHHHARGVSLPRMRAAAWNIVCHDPDNSLGRAGGTR